MERDLKLLVDAIDMHVHSNPALFERSIDDADFRGASDGLWDARVRAEGSRQRHDGSGVSRGSVLPSTSRRFGREWFSTARWGAQPATSSRARCTTAPASSGFRATTPGTTRVLRHLGLSADGQEAPAAGGRGTDDLRRGRRAPKPEVEKICDLVAEEDACLATGHMISRKSAPCTGRRRSAG